MGQLTNEEIKKGVDILDSAIKCILTTLGASSKELTEDWLMQTAIALNDLQGTLTGCVIGGM